jgi:acetolactate synthase-1/2/3 large subunit
MSSIVADLLVSRLGDHGVPVLFGYPGGQLTPLYDALHRAGTVRHILARDEQAAAFMADGYARATGEPGVCLAVCGPGVNNAVTPLATAYTDSVPFLLISGQVYSAGRGLRSGYYHENEQARVCETCTKVRIRVEEPGAIVAAVDRAFLAMRSGRPGPVLLEVPVDVLRAEATLDPGPSPPTRPPASPPDPARIEALAQRVARWQRPLLLAGGGVITAGASAPLRELAERLGAPVFHTAMGKGAFPAAHPLHAGLPWHRATSDLTAMESFFDPRWREADGLLAIGCRFTQLTTGSWTLPLPPEIAQIDVDPEEIGRHYPVATGVAADARAALEALLGALPAARREPWSQARVHEPWRIPGVDLLGPMRRALPPETIVVADVTRLGYILMAEFPLAQPRTFLHPAGYVAMGYGIPAALGARAAFPRRPIVAVAGDGCFLMSGMELATAVQERLPVVVVLINDHSLTLIKAIQQRRYSERYLGVDLHNPDFALFARAFGVRHWGVHDDAGFEIALREALACGETALVEVQLPG